MLRLVPVEAVPGEAFVDALRRAWADGDAVLPVDPRLPSAVALAVVAAMRPDEPVEPGDALVVATSGTTGDPKGVLHIHNSAIATIDSTIVRQGIGPSDIVHLAIPVGHTFGYFYGVRCALQSRACLLLQHSDLALKLDDSLLEVLHVLLNRLAARALLVRILRRCRGRHRRGSLRHCAHRSE